MKKYKDEEEKPKKYKRKYFNTKRFFRILFTIIIIVFISIFLTINIIKDVKKESFKSSISSIMESVSDNCLLEVSEKRSITSIYLFEEDSVNPSINTEEELPTSGYMLVDDDCNVTINISNGVYNAKKLPNYSDIEVMHYEEIPVTDNYKYENSHTIYFNPNTNSKCNDYNIDNSLTGVKNGCMKWYVFNDNTSSNTVSLILDHNLTSGIPWSSNGSNVRMNEVINQLNSDTQTWNQSLAPRLITANEVPKVMGSTWSPNAARPYYYFDSNSDKPKETCKLGDTSECYYGWFYDRTNTVCEDYGCLNNSDVETSGYWTSSPRSGFADTAWYVSYEGRLVYSQVNNNTIGVRPVITTLKTNID